MLEVRTYMKLSILQEKNVNVNTQSQQEFEKRLQHYNKFQKKNHRL